MSIESGKHGLGAGQGGHQGCDHVQGHHHVTGGHAHADHGHGIEGKRDVQVIGAIVINSSLSLAQLFGGVIAGSVALIADALHNFSDALAFLLALVARRIARRDAHPAMSFGYGRAETVAALINFTVLVMIAIWLGYEAAARMISPPEVTGSIVIVLAALGVLFNATTALLTWRLAKESANIRAAFLHNTADAATSVAVLVGGIVIQATGWNWVDPVITLAISAWILWHALTEMGPVIRILMLGAPSGLMADTIRNRLLAEKDVEGVHHMHLWQIDERRNSLEAHLILRDGADFTDVTRRMKALVAKEFGIFHATFEAETSAEGCSSPSCA